MMIREPAVAGAFYPASASKLKDELAVLFELARVREKIDGIIGVVSPHAGIVYSGKTAAYAFKSLPENKYERVIIISPSHREYFPGVSIYSGDAYKTPLGIVPLDLDAREILTSKSKFIFPGQQGHRGEHALEIQLPFLQTVLGEFKIVPVVMGDQQKVFIDELSKRLVEIIDDKTLIVASSDLSHFYPRAEADELDSVIEKHIADFDYNGLQEDLDNGKCEACGGGAIVTMMQAADLVRKKKSKILNRTDSGEVSGDLSEVVGYLSAAVYN